MLSILSSILVTPFSSKEVRSAYDIIYHGYTVHHFEMYRKIRIRNHSRS